MNLLPVLHPHSEQDPSISILVKANHCTVHKATACTG